MSDKKHFAIEFKGNEVRVVFGEHADAISHQPNVLLNPDVSSVKGLSPHHWDFSKDGGIVPRVPPTRRPQPPIKNPKASPVPPPLRAFLIAWAVFALITAAGAIFTLLLRKVGF